MRLLIILLSITGLVAVLVSTVFLYGNAHKRHSTPEQFADAESSAFRAYGANPEPHFVTLPGSGIRAHYLESGRGQPLLAIHGGNSMSASWAPLVPALAGNSRLIMVDRPGCGLTDKLNYRSVAFRQHSVEFTREFLDAIGVRKTSIIANSMGGYFGLAFALAYPERVDKLILIGSPPMINDSAPLPHMLLGIPGLNRFIYALRATKESLGGPAKPLSWLYARPEKLRPESVAAQQSAEALPGAEMSWLTMVEEVVRHYKTTYNLKNELAHIKAPALFVIGDMEGAVDTTRELATTMPNARKLIISDAAHIPWVDDTKACERAILEFLAEAPEEAGTRTRPLNLGTPPTAAGGNNIAASAHKR